MELQLIGPRILKVASLASALALVMACSSPQSSAEVPKKSSAAESEGDAVTTKRPAPAVPKGAVSEANEANIKKAITAFRESDSKNHLQALFALGDSGDPRIGWLLSDFLRVSPGSAHSGIVLHSAERLLGFEINPRDPWKSLTNQLMAWDLPAIPGYLEHKRGIYTEIVPGWERLMSTEGTVDWRHVSWGGVGIDDRPYDKTHLQVRSIPAVDNPSVTNAAGGSWLSDDAPIFGVAIKGEARAYPRFIMEIREMANDTLGGRDFALPYCTLCGSAQLWFTDQLPAGAKRPVLRTSGLLIRSNKLMYDVVSGSVFDTFLGHATNGPLHDQGLQLKGHTVIATTWGEWKDTHPQTTVLAKKESLGRISNLRETRDANGPIFPIGTVDPRLSVQTEVIGVLNSAGEPLAFPRAEALRSLAEGKSVTLAGATLKLEAGGLAALDQAGKPLVAHDSFWFGWSQFRPETKLWSPTP